MSEEHAMQRFHAPSCAIIAVALVCAATLLCATGCVRSDTITEKIYDNNPESTVDKTVPPALINSATATKVSSVLPRLSNDDTSEKQDQKEEEMPIYDGDYDAEQTELRAADPQASSAADDTGEASKKTSDDPDTNNEEGTDDEGDGDNETDDSDKTDKKAGDEIGGDPEIDDDEVDEGDEEANRDKEEGKKKSGGTGSSYTTDPNAEEPEIPENIDEVAAVGNAAVIVSMVSGTKDSSALVACDEKTKSKTRKVLANKGISKAQALWTGDGSSSGDLSSANLKKLVKDVVPDLVFVMEGDTTLTSAQADKLSDANIDVYTLPKLTSATRIAYAVELVGKVLDKGGVEGAEDNYKEYLSYHKQLVKKYLDANGGMTGGFDFDAAESADPPATDISTLYVDKWDSGARYGGSAISTHDGVAVATLGYEKAPLNYYLSVGGVLNNAASSLIRNQETNKAGIVWQFDATQMPYKFSKWNGLDEATFDLQSKLSRGGFANDLLWSNKSRCGLGTDNFPALIAASDELKDRLEENANEPGDIYYPYPTISPGGTGNTVGYFYDTSDTHGGYAESCIGNDNSGNSVLNGTLYPIYVNPKGLCQEDSEDALCSWARGSVESVLEASWANYRFRGGSESAFKADVEEFYQTFYDYELTDSDFSKIADGPAE